jgi:hypothetical protein
MAVAIDSANAKNMNEREISDKEMKNLFVTMFYSPATN